MYKIILYIVSVYLVSNSFADLKLTNKEDRDLAIKEAISETWKVKIEIEEKIKKLELLQKNEALSVEQGTPQKPKDPLAGLTPFEERSLKIKELKKHRDEIILGERIIVPDLTFMTKKKPFALGKIYDGKALFFRNLPEKKSFVEINSKINNIVNAKDRIILNQQFPNAKPGQEIQLDGLYAYVNKAELILTLDEARYLKTPPFKAFYPVFELDNTSAIRIAEGVLKNSSEKEGKKKGTKINKKPILGLPIKQLDPLANPD